MPEAYSIDYILGFIVDSRDMTVQHSVKKVDKALSAVRGLQSSPTWSICEVAQVIGNLVSLLPGVQLGQLHYRSLEIDKHAALKSNHFFFLCQDEGRLSCNN